jgi:hypothetical protein
MTVCVPELMRMNGGDSRLPASPLEHLGYPRISEVPPGTKPEPSQSCVLVANPESQVSVQVLDSLRAEAR